MDPSVGELLIQSTRRPLITFNRIITTAITKRIWIKPPTAGNAKNPSSHNIIRTTAIVYNMIIFPYNLIFEYHHLQFKN